MTETNGALTKERECCLALAEDLRKRREKDAVIRYLIKRATSVEQLQQIALAATRSAAAAPNGFASAVNAHAAVIANGNPPLRVVILKSRADHGRTPRWAVARLDIPVRQKSDAVPSRAP
jgi:hypothetical protein